MKHSRLAGQVLTEFAISLLIFIPIGFGAAYFVRDVRYRFQCIYYTFENTHAELVGDPQQVAPVPLLISQSAHFIKGQTQCKKILEKVQFKKIEAKQ